MDELLGEVPDENLMEEETADQGGPEGENTNEKEVERETPGDGGDGDKVGEFPNDVDKEKPNETSEIIDRPTPQDGGQRHSDCQSN